MMEYNYKYISFDIFDTLVFRCVSKPTDVFRIVENYVKKYYPNQCIEGYYNLRINSERNARRGKIDEISFDEIYNSFPNEISRESINIYKEAEIKIELSVCVPNLKIKKIYEELIANGKEIIITSDMYLPAVVIKEILKNCGYSSYYKLFLSGEIGIRKSSGKLFKYVCEDLAVRPQDILHIGDNIKSDFLMAKINGFKSSWVPTKSLKIYNSDLTNNIVRSFVKYKSKSGGIYEEIGYSTFGSFLYGYLNWLHSNLKAGEYDRVFFLSRDGYFMRKAYISLFKESSIDTEYLYVSRRLLMVATIWKHADLSDIVSNMYLPPIFSLEWFVDMIGLSKDYISNLNIKFDYEVNRATMLEDSLFMSFYVKLKDVMIENSKKEYDALLTYLHQISFAGKVAIVDVGWIGNMQKHLTQTAKDLNIDVDITGYYVGCNPLSQNLSIQKMRGYIFDGQKNKDLFIYERWMENVFELFFMAPHGSAKKYVIRDNMADVELYDFEYEKSPTREFYFNIQNEALRFVLEFSKYNKFLSDFETSAFYSDVIDKFSNPTFRIAKVFGDLNYWDKKWIKFAKPKPLFKYILNPFIFVDDFTKSPWKPGFLKRLIPLPINYGRILAWIYAKRYNII